MQRKKLIVIGGGAAGFFCAVNAAGGNLDVTILEKGHRVLQKVKASGGGRCNVTNATFSIAAMVRQYPRGSRFLKEAFGHFFTTDTIAWFENRGVPLKTEADGRVFPVSDSSGAIISCLLREADTRGVTLQMNQEVESVTVTGSGQFQVGLRGAGSLVADYVCVACGGYPVESRYGWIQALGHRIESPVPSLFTFNIPGNNIVDLSGISLEGAAIRIQDTSFTSSGPLLITHWGFSGPAILRLSAVAARELATRGYQFSITVNWIEGFHETLMTQTLASMRKEAPSRMIGNQGCKSFHVPQRFWDYQLQCCEIPSTQRWADLSTKQQNRLARALCSQPFDVRGKTTFKEEFVTAGGVRLEDIDPSTMQSKRLAGLFFAGEIMDVDGVTGGYNFQHAWTSGFLAAKTISEMAGLSH